MTYLIWHGEFSQKIPNKHSLDCLDFLRETFLYIEKQKYELWYCIYNGNIAQEIMPIDKEYMDYNGWSFEEYATFKLWGLQVVLDPLVEFLQTFDYVNKEELVTFLQDTLALEWGVKYAEILTPENVIDKVWKDISAQVDQDDTPATERTLEDILAQIEDPEELEDQKHMDAFIKELEENPFSHVEYESEMPPAYVETLLWAANGIYEVFTEMVYSQNRYKDSVPDYVLYMQKLMYRRHPSSTTAYLDRIISKNFLTHRQEELKNLEMKTDRHHNNYHNVKLDILYDTFRTKSCLETDDLPLAELTSWGNVSFRYYEKKLDDSKKEFRGKHHSDTGQRLSNQFKIIPLDEKTILPIVERYSDSAEAKINTQGDEKTED